MANEGNMEKGPSPRSRWVPGLGFRVRVRVRVRAISEQLRAFP